MGGDRQGGVYETVMDIRECLPHRYPFLFIDMVKSVSAGRTILAVKNVTHADCYGEAGSRCFPPEYIIEICGQAAILLFFADGTRDIGSVNTLLVGVDKFSVYDRAREGDCIEVEVTLEKVISNAAIIAGRALVDGRIIADVKLSAAFVKKVI